MKTTENETSIIVSNKVGEQTTFKIKTTATAFKLLSDGLYSNKIGSMIRELLCNAYDAHKEAGTLDTPIMVELPTILEPSFRVRDYGTGLSEEAMKRIYTTYFESTKSNNNDFIGGFGLGSKTPLCYNNEQFFVRSYFNGKMYLYNVSIGESGAPILTKWDEADTDEHNGLEIELAVRKDDVETFRTELFKFNMWAGFNLNINGATSVSYKYDRIFDTADAFVPYLDGDAEANVFPFCGVENTPLFSIINTLNNQLDTCDGYFIRIGKVGYRVPKSVFADNYQMVLDNLQSIYDEAERITGKEMGTERRLEYTRRFFALPSGGTDSLYDGNSFVYDFKVGELDVTASRENISFTGRTLKTLMVKLVGMSVAILFKEEMLYRKTFDGDFRKIISENIAVFASKEIQPVLFPIVNTLSKPLPNENCEIGPCFEPIERLTAECTAIKYHRLNYSTACKRVYREIVKSLTEYSDRTEYKPNYYSLTVRGDGSLDYGTSSIVTELSRVLVLNRRINILVSTASIDRIVVKDSKVITQPKTPVIFVKARTAKIGLELIARLNEENKNPNCLFTFNAEFVRQPRPKPRDPSKIKMRKFIAFKIKTGELYASEVMETDNLVRDAVKEKRRVLYIPIHYDWRELLGSIDYLRGYATHLGRMLNSIHNDEQVFVFFSTDRKKAFEADYPDLFGGEYLHDFTDNTDEYMKPLWRIADKAFAFPFRDIFLFRGNPPVDTGKSLEYWNSVCKTINTTLDKPKSFLQAFYMRNRPRVAVWGTLLFTMLDRNGIGIESLGLFMYFVQRTLGYTPAFKHDDEPTLDTQCEKIVDRLNTQQIKVELERFCKFDAREYQRGAAIIPLYQKLTQRLLDNLEKGV